MPLALEPGGENFVWLDSDAHLPIETRPVFVIKVLPMRGQIKLADAFDNYLKTLSTPQQASDEILRVLSLAVIGWRNIVVDGKPLEFSIDAMADVLTMQEAAKLVTKIMSYQRTSDEEKKS